MWAKGDSLLNRGATFIAGVFHRSFKVPQADARGKGSWRISDSRFQITVFVREYFNQIRNLLLSKRLQLNRVFLAVGLHVDQSENRSLS